MSKGEGSMRLGGVSSCKSSDFILCVVRSHQSILSQRNYYGKEYYFLEVC